MNITELEKQYGPIPDNLDRKKIETLLKKRVNKNTLLSVSLQDSVESWLHESNLNWSETKLNYPMLDGSSGQLTCLEIEHKIILILVDDYSTFNKKVIHKNTATKLHQKLLSETDKRVMWCKKFEWETPTKQNVLKSMIIHALGKTPNRTYARNTVCEVIDNASSKKFLEEASFYGYRSASQVIALKDKKTGELLQVFSCGFPLYGKKEFQNEKIIECIRSAGKPFHQVVGGMTKIIKFYLDTFGNDIGGILYFVDDAHQHGSGMESGGFKFSHFSGNAVHNVFSETESVAMRMPFLHKEVMYFQKLGLIYGVPDVGSSAYVMDLRKIDLNDEKSVVDDI